jgi:hypothetical protein
MRTRLGIAVPLGRLGNRVGAGIAFVLIALMIGLVIVEMFLAIMRAHF